MVPSPATLSRFVIPRVRNGSGLDVGFALVNTGTTAANITVTLKDSTGATVAARTLSMGAGTQTSGFANQLLATGCAPCLGTEPPGTTYSHLRFESTSASFAATALAAEAGTLTTIPVEFCSRAPCGSGMHPRR